MICSHCSAEMPEISAFCPACGRSVYSPAEDAERWSVPAESVSDLLLGALAYVGLLPAILFLTLTSLRASGFVRFHSWQSIFFTIACVLAGILTRILFWILLFIPVIGLLAASLLVGLVFLAALTLWIVLLIKALQGQSYELPWVGPLAARLVLAM